MSVSPAAEPTGTLAQALQHAARLLDREPTLAAEQAVEILKVFPTHPGATLLLGSARRAAGNPAAALAVLQPLITAHPTWAVAHFELGMTLSDLEWHDDALSALRRAVELRPDLPDAWREIGDRLALRGDTEGAHAAYAQHIKASTKDPRLMSAAAALSENEIPKAELLLREHLKQFPTDVAAIRMLAEVAGRLGRYIDAENLLARCLELAPSFNAARFNYALALHRQAKYVPALREIEMLTAAEPHNSAYRNSKAVILGMIGEYPQSIELYADILSKHPDEYKIWTSYGHVLTTAGRTAEGIAAYRRAIAITPTFGEAYYSLANLKTFRFEDTELATMREHLAGSAITPEDRAHFHFAIGKALEDSKNFADSFDHYVEGNKLRLARVGWDPEEGTTLVQRSKALFTQEFFAARRDFGTPAADPIFIVGMPRAGSTLVEQILASHSSVEGTMELPNIMSLAATLGKKRRPGEKSIYPEVLAGLSAEECRTLGEQYLEQTRIQRKTAKPFFIDKMPNNFLHIGAIRLLLPRARIIDARRHPMACCFSNFKQNFAQGQRYTYHLEHLGQYYREYVELMAHFDAVAPGAIHRVIYENMVSDTEGEVRSLLEFCGLAFEPTTLRFYENERAVRTASSQQVRQPIYREGIDQWRNFEPWLEPLRHSLGTVLTTYPDVPQF
jgi:tetratricopeptide (TPR) repeat protein